MATATQTGNRVPNWVMGGAPLLIIAALIALFVALDPIGALRQPPPVEEIAIERSVLKDGSIELHLRNDGPNEVTVAQVLVNDAYRDHTIGDRTLGRLETTTMTIPYPWEEGLPLNIALITANGVTIEHEIEAATLTPEADARTFGIYALLGLYIGVIPIAVGLLWFPALRRASRRWLGFFLAFTIGLLAFLLVDTISEGLELASETASRLNGVALFAIGALVAVIGLTWLEGALGRKRSVARSTASTGALLVAYLVAAGIGLHNLGEGLAVGSALAAGEVALGTFLVLGFAIHNTTEGLAIVAPLGTSDKRPSLWHFAALGALAGAPTIAGAWLGGFAFIPAVASIAFGVAAGAIAQVVWTIGKTMTGEASLTSGAGTLGFVGGLVVMYLTGLFTA
jgi:zinc transporter ZupT